MAQTQRGVFEKVPGSGVFYARYRVAGRLYREVAGTKTQARKLYKLRTADALQGKLPPALRNTKVVTFAEIAGDAEAHSRKNKKSFQDDVERLELLVKWFGNLPVDKLSATDIEKKLTETAIERSWSPATVNRYRATLSLAYRLAIRTTKKVTTGNPAKDVPHQREDNQIVRWLTDDEETRLKAAIKKPERWAAVLFSINTGMRAGEQWGLVWSDIDLETQQARLLNTKNGSIRYVELNQYAMDALKTMQGRPQPNGYVFDQQQHRVWFERACAAAKVTEYHWHCNRHSTATRLVKAGVPLHVVAAILGHKSLDMVLRYAHFAPKEKKEAMSKLVVSPKVSQAA